MPATHNAHGGGYGTVGALSATFTGDLLPDVVLTAQFGATGATTAVPVPSGISAGSLQTFTFGAPTTATVVLQGSIDGGTTWVTLPATPSPAATTRYTSVRLNCTALSGGTTPAIVAVAICYP